MISLCVGEPNKPSLLLHHGVGRLSRGVHGFLAVDCWRVAARYLSNDRGLSRLVERARNEFSLLISIELLGCSTAVVFFVGLSISKIDVLYRNG